MQLLQPLPLALVGRPVQLLPPLQLALALVGSTQLQVTRRCNHNSSKATR